MNILFLLLLGAPLIAFVLYLLALAILKKKKHTMRLSIYGWAFVIVLIVMICLWQLGSPPPRYYNRSTGFLGSKLGAIDATIKCTPTDLSILLINQAGGTLSNITVAQSNRGYEGVVTGVGAAGTLIPNEKATLVMDADTLFVVGDRVTTDVVVTYNEMVARQIITWTQSGMIMCTVE